MNNRGYDSWTSMSSFDPRKWFEAEAETVRLITHDDVSSRSKLDIEDLLYALNAFMATLKPVALSLLIACLVVVFVQIPISGSDGMVAYTINDSTDSDSDKLGKSVANALIIVAFVAFITFLLVFLYWMRCMKCLMGYMVFSSSVLLGILGGFLWLTALVTFDLPCDTITFFWVLYNFSVVGVMAIFYQSGIPTIVTQGYLVATTVILAWNLSKFDEWTCWALLVALAFWDLCAVLTPCGPLQMLVGMMQTRNEPLPGLLYEAQLPPPPDQLRNYNTMVASRNNSNAIELSRRTSSSGDEDHYAHHTELGGERMFPRKARHITDVSTHSLEEDAATVESSSNQKKVSIPSLASMGLGVVGIGLMTNSGQSNNKNSVTRTNSTPLSASSYSDVELSDNSIDRSNTALRGARERDSPVSSSRPMNRAGDSAASPPTRIAGDDSTNGPEDYSIKLGMGDFVFYSVLVTRAATYGFCSGIICALVIVGGLGITLVLLSVFRQALPALPISILLGFLFYLSSRFLIIPLLEDTVHFPFYV